MTSVQDHNIKSDQAINKIIAQEIEKAINTYIEKFNQEFDSELENAFKDIITIRKLAIKNPDTTNDV